MRRASQDTVVVIHIIFTHTAAGVGLLAAYCGCRQLGLPFWPAALLSLPAAALVGLLCTQTLRHNLQLATLTLARLAANQPPGLWPPAQRQPLAALLNAAELLVRQERERDSARREMLRQAGEAAAAEERNRLARDLHDSIKQQIFSINASAAAAQARWEHDPGGAQRALEDVRRSAQEAMIEMQALLQQLRPLPVESVGLVQALKEQCEALHYRSGAQVDMEFGALPEADRLPAGAADALFRMAQEALSNVARHARAQHVTVRLEQVQEAQDGTAVEALVLLVADNGVGFDRKANSAMVRPAAKGRGLVNLAERAHALGATLHVVSVPNEGTTVMIRLPLAPPAARQQEEAAMQTTVNRWIDQARTAETIAGAGLGFVILNLLLAAPLILSARAAPQLPSPLIALAVPVLAIGGGLALAVYGLARRQRAQAAIAAGADDNNIAHLRLQAALHSQRMWLYLVAAMVLPAALLRQDRPQYPAAALALGLVLLGLAVFEVLRTRAATEQTWRLLRDLGKQEQLAQALEQAWSQRFTPLLVLGVTLPGYLFLRFGGDPAGRWFAFPPTRADVYNMLATAYVLVLVIWSVVNWEQIRRWRHQD